jgi:phosphoribosylformylglycinamidine synthase
MSLDANPRFCYLSPRAGARHAVAESCRNLACTGARPLAATNCLNFASPENPETMWQFSEVIEGMAEACRMFDTPITGGNVSFYNETNGRGIFPTPVMGVLGVLDRVADACPSAFRNEDDLVFLVGSTGADLGGSVYLEFRGLPLSGPCPEVDLEQERVLQRLLVEAVSDGLVHSAHDLSDGGLAVALAECCLVSGLGFDGKLSTVLRPDHFLFSETPGRVLVSIGPKMKQQFESRFARLGTMLLGQVAGNGRIELEINGTPRIDLNVHDLAETWHGGLERALAH